MNGTNAQTFRDNVVVVTGASSGIGRELAYRFADQRALLSLAGRDPGRLESVAEACRGRGARALAIATDVADQEQCRRLVDQTVAEYGRIDTLVNNAGITMWSKFEDMKDLSPFEQIMRVNYLGSVYCTPWLDSSTRYGLRSPNTGSPSPSPIRISSSLRRTSGHSDPMESRSEPVHCRLRS